MHRTGEWLWVICEELRERDIQVVERVRLEVPDGLGEEAGADEEEEVGHDDHEDRECCMCMYGEHVGSIPSEEKSTDSSGWRTHR